MPSAATPPPAPIVPVTPPSGASTGCNVQRGGTEKGAILGALFDPLDEDTRARYRIGTKRDQTRAAADGGDGPVPRADAPETPWQFTFGDWTMVGKRTIEQVGEDRVSSVAAGVTFFALLAMFPALTALVSLYGLFAEPSTISRHLDLLQSFLPAEALGIIRTQIEAITSAPGTALSFAGIFALLMAFYSATGGAKAMIDALNVAFFLREKRSFIVRNLLAMAFTIAGMLLAIAMIGVIAVIPILLQWLPLPGGTEWLVVVLRWPLMFGVLMLSLAAIYHWGPDKPRTRWEWISPGAILASVGLILASMLFSWYAANLTDFNETYGSLGAVIGLMTWLWIASMVVLVGAELNSEVERHLRLLHGQPVPDETGGNRAPAAEPRKG